MTSSNLFYTPCVAAHIAAVRDDDQGFLKELTKLQESGTISTLLTTVRSAILIALHVNAKHAALNQFFRYCEVKDIVNALTFLDSQRAVRQLTARITRIENEHPRLIPLIDEEDDTFPTLENKKRKPRRKIDGYRRKLRMLEGSVSHVCPNPSLCVKEAHENSAIQEIMNSPTGFSGALARKVRTWAGTLQEGALEFVMLSMPDKALWRRLADLVHFSPTDFRVPYFLLDVHNETIPEDSLVARLRGILTENGECPVPSKLVGDFGQVAKDFPHVFKLYAFLRLQASFECAEMYEYLAERIPLEAVLWDMEDFYRVSKRCNNIVLSRLPKEMEQLEQSGDKVTTFGKLMERILTFRRLGLNALSLALQPLAERRLEKLKSYWSEKMSGKKVAVIGDASASMQVAVESAAIFASLVSVCFDGRLSFYNDRLVQSPHARPKNSTEALHICSSIRAGRCTAPAAALWEYLDQGLFVDLFVHVTDEVENTRFKGKNHAEVLQEYKNVVNPNVKLVIVTVGKGYRNFKSDLERQEINYQTITIDGSRPDLTKFDVLLGRLATDLEEDDSGVEDFVVVGSD